MSGFGSTNTKGLIDLRIGVVDRQFEIAGNRHVGNSHGHRATDLAGKPFVGDEEGTAAISETDKGLLAVAK